jgi:hypothetical protein
MSLNLLTQIGRRLAARPEALGLLALGSSGRDTARHDPHSDLDFFVIADDREPLLADLSWLGPVQWAHRNTVDGYRVLVDGVLCEFAVFDRAQLDGVAGTGGRWVWRGPECPDVTLVAPEPPAPEWVEAEVLSCLYIGLQRWLRGERMAAMRMVQGEALSLLLRSRGSPDPFDPTRRAESLGLALAHYAPGYEHTPASAARILDALDPAANAMRDAVEELLQRCR